MEKIAFLFEGDVYNPRGEFIAIHNRLKYYQQRNKNLVDAYVCWPKYGRMSAALTHTKNGKLVSSYEIDGVCYHCIWYPKSLVDGITHKIFKSCTDFEYNYLLKMLDLKKYDLISAHSLKCARIAYYYKKNFGIPYIVTWHGSSIHSLPFSDKKWYIQTQDVLRFADCNLFVSRELQRISNLIAPNNSTISFNGIDTGLFYKMSLKEISDFKTRIGLSGREKVIAYVGNCYPIKNVGFLPKLFCEISKYIPDCHFCIVGNGRFKEMFTRSNLHITYFGSISYYEMPYYYNSFDLVVLPSINEGLPMTCLEATACGTYFVGSRVGEIENVVGSEFTVQRDSSFEDSFINKCIEILKTNPVIPFLKPEYNVEQIVANEIRIIKNILAS